MIEKGTYVRIKKVILDPNERASQIPDDTKKQPFLMWIKGFLLVDAQLYDTVSIKTTTGRIESGVLIEVHPYFEHSFGKYVPILGDVKQIIDQETEDLE